MTLTKVSGRTILLALLCVAATGFGARGEAVAAGQAAANPAPAGSAGSVPAANAGARKRKPAAPAKVETSSPVAAIIPPTPPTPNWPVNDKAVPASVDWNGRILSISATNSSLQQILSDVATATGVKVEGAPNDQRVYGSYGPAPARDVLSQLLDGSGYNVLMIGDQGEGTPRTLVLTVKSTAPVGNAGSAQARPNAEEEAPEEPEPVEQPEPAIRRPPGMNPMGRNPQQMRQDMEQRLQQQQQLQQGAPVQPQPVPATPPNQ